MSKIILAFIFQIFIFNSGLFAQNCSSYYPMEKGVEYVMLKYDKKGKLESTSKNRIVDFRKEGGKEIAVIHIVTIDAKGKETTNSEYDIICDGNSVTMDINSLLKEKLAATNTNNADVEISGTNPVIPNELSVGQNLPGSSMQMEFSSGSMNMKFGVETTNKKVIGEEKVTVPAGTFDCIVISQDTETKLMITKNTEVKTWLANGVGVVKEETYNKKGDLISYEILTEFVR